MSRRRKPAVKARGPGFVRIIAGSHRGSRLPVADVPGLRPSPDRLRETLFNWISPELSGARCLDLFAGTGALGFEALSRGADSVVMVEAHPQAVAALKAASERLSLGGVTILAADVGVWLLSPKEPFDMVFLDPPYQQGGHEKLCASLHEHGLLNRNAFVFVEMPADAHELQLPQAWRLRRSTRVGNACGLLYQVNGSQ